MYKAAGLWGCRSTAPSGLPELLGLQKLPEAQIAGGAFGNGEDYGDRLTSTTVAGKAPDAGVADGGFGETGVAGVVCEETGVAGQGLAATRVSGGPFAETELAGGSSAVTRVGGWYPNRGHLRGGLSVALIRTSVSCHVTPDAVDIADAVDVADTT